MTSANATSDMNPALPSINFVLSCLWNPPSSGAASNEESAASTGASSRLSAVESLAAAAESFAATGAAGFAVFAFAISFGAAGAPLPSFGICLPSRGPPGPPGPPSPGSGLPSGPSPISGGAFLSIALAFKVFWICCFLLLAASVWLGLQKHSPMIAISLFILYEFNISAERGGFEPPKPFRSLHAFQACLFNHSSIFPFPLFRFELQNYSFSDDFPHYFV